MTAVIVERRYGVSAIEWPYFGMMGHLAGVPVCMVRFDKQAKAKYTADDMCRAIKALVPRDRAMQPRWCAFMNGDGQVDNNLLVYLRVRLEMLFYFETSGLAPMSDSAQYGGRCPMYDHVCVRVALPYRIIRTELFHSVMVVVPPKGGDLVPLSLELNRRAFNAPRYVLHRGPACREAVTRNCHSNWRLTAPVVS